MFQPHPGKGYDMAITMFSPDGRIFQVEYARESVKRGATVVGIKYREGIVLAADKRITSRLAVPESIEKIFQIDDHIGVAASGMIADTRALVERMRVEAQDNRTRYNEPVDVSTLVKGICDFMQLYTQYGGARPFGTSILVAGMDSMAGLYEIDPSGALLGYKATAIGEGRRAVMEFFEENYSEEMNRDESIKLALEALRDVNEGTLTGETIDLVIIDLKDGYTKFSAKGIDGYIASLKPKKS
jgi:proteasome alpha subunit